MRVDIAVIWYDYHITDRKILINLLQERFQYKVYGYVEINWWKVVNHSSPNFLVSPVFTENHVRYTT